MGLDQYLYVKRWISYDDKKTALKVSALFPKFKDHAEPKEVSFQLMYWGKANAIHKWFVDNCQDGKDDCGQYYVSTEKLMELREICKKIIKWHDAGEIARAVMKKEDLENPKDLLPPTEGFFFGGTDLDDYYFEGIRSTLVQLDWWFSLPVKEKGRMAHRVSQFLVVYKGDAYVYAYAPALRALNASFPYRFVMKMKRDMRNITSKRYI